MQSVSVLRQRLGRARRVMIVGNGGIALEAAYGVRVQRRAVATVALPDVPVSVRTAMQLETCEVVWVMRHKFLGNTFFDASASRFFLEGKALGAGATCVARRTSPGNTCCPAGERSTGAGRGTDAVGGQGASGKGGACPAARPRRGLASHAVCACC